MATKNTTYSNGELRIIWKPELCIHSANCVKGLPAVFNPKERPWIKVENADTQALIKTINNCPSGALSYIRKGEKQKSDKVKIEAMKDGPLIVSGNVVVEHVGKETVYKNRVALCRCGASQRKPICDGSHKKVGFVG